MSNHEVTFSVYLDHLACRAGGFSRPRKRRAIFFSRGKSTHQTHQTHRMNQGIFEVCEVCEVTFLRKKIQCRIQSEGNNPYE